ncbi:hypothetical protein HPB47_023833 [Ixodes persulcatus]|uniref:Uncharacterized protein n=1 Tax=Ixodes persulcatus TaxID=34615 RepID=A0AC60Q699_IXOPE|nr:hypothetical protein HPB47_023833 [Ixodes persulcatus]
MDGAASGSSDKEALVRTVNDVVPRTHVLPLRARLAYSVGHVLNDLCASMWFTYLLVYLTFVRQFRSTLAGALLLVGQVADALATPFVGIESDRDDDFWLCRYGRRKTWHLVGTLCVMGTFPFLFSKPLGGEGSTQEAEFVYFAALIVIFQLGWAATQISHLSLIPDLTPIPHERVELNALRYSFTVASNILVYTVTWVALGISGTDHEAQVGPQDAHVFRNIVLIVVGIGSLFSLVFHVVVRDPSRGGRRESVSRHRDEYVRSLVLERSQHLRWREWFRERRFYVVGLLYMSTRLYVNLSQVFIPMYIQETLKLHRQSIAIIPLVMYVSGFVSSLPVKYATRFIGTKNVYLLGGVLGVAGSVWIMLGQSTPGYTRYQIYGIAVLVGMAGTTVLLASLAITNELIGGHTTSGAFVFGAMSFLDKMANGIVVITVQDLRSCGTREETETNYYQYVVALACGGAAAFGIILALFLLWDKDAPASRLSGNVSTNSLVADHSQVRCVSPADLEDAVDQSPSSPLLGPSPTL